MKDGGPAFPVIPWQIPTVSGAGMHYQSASAGMSLRDYFAAAAAESILLTELNADRIAKLAYQVADAMLAQREKP